MLRIFLFGATGDLSIKKLYPALFALHVRGDLPTDHEILCIGRRNYTQDDFQQFIAESVGGTRDVKQWFSFIRKLSYRQVQFDNYEDYEGLKKSLLNPSDDDTHIFYLATSPTYFQSISKYLSDAQLLRRGQLNHRIVIEKPFGEDLESAQEINNALDAYLTENQIYRMDHYLGKEMIQNIMMLRFDNTLFEASWHADAIDHVQITVAESYGVFERAGYYEQSGAVRDMIQSHLLQMVALVAMGPECIQTDNLCTAKADVLKQLRLEDVTSDVVLGQYTSSEGLKGYTEEVGVNPNSVTETYAAMRLTIDHERWRGVDFYLRTGKRLSSKVSEIVIVYKHPKHAIDKNTPQNTLTIQIHPQEGMKVKFNMKQPGANRQLVTREMVFCQSCLIDYNAPEAYETLIAEVVQGKHDLYTRWDEVKGAWEFVASILKACKDKALTLHPYAAGSRGPVAADALIEKSGRSWISL